MNISNDIIGWYRKNILGIKKEEKMNKIKRNSYAIVTVEKDGNEDLKMLTKTLRAGYYDSEKLECITDYDEAAVLAREAAKKFHEVYLVKIKSAFKCDIEDELED